VCTLIIAWRVLADAPVVVAANRDEATDRPSTPPAPWAGAPRIVAPRDERAGGTWIGYNEAGLFVGISNRWSDEQLPAGRSRGLLVADALGQESAESAAGVVEDALAADPYDGFNLVLADADVAMLLQWGGRLDVTEFDPGVHVVMNAGFDEQFRAVEARRDAARHQAENARSVRAALRPDPDEDAEAWLDRAGAVLGGHDFGVCVHGDGYGTRSSSLLALYPDGTATFRYADGPPCETPFESVVRRPAEGQS